MIVSLKGDVAEKVQEVADSWGTEPDEVVDRVLRKCLLDGRDGIQDSELIGAEDEY